MDVLKVARETVKFSKTIFGDEFIPLHRPVFEGNEKQYLLDCIDSNFVSSVGERVDDFEDRISKFTTSKYAVAAVNGTAALHISILLSGVEKGDEVISQALTFIATCNAISYSGASPVFIDVDRDTLGMSPLALKTFLETNAEIKNGVTLNKKSGRRISACIPMHTYGMPCRVKEIASICEEWNIPLIEDCAESLGSYVEDRHTGTFGKIGTLSFNGNKVITTGGGGMLLTDCPELAKKAKHITTTAKVPHPYEFVHDEIAYNYRLPNLNAALGCAQMEQLSKFLLLKAQLAEKWDSFFNDYGVFFCKAIENHKSNNWLNSILFDSKKDRNKFLEYTNENGVMTRPVWKLMNELKMFENCQHDNLDNSRWLSERLVNIPSSVPNGSINNIRG